MKNLLYISFIFLLFLSCNKEEEYREKCCCMDVNTDFFIEIIGSNTKNFLNSEGNFDEENVYFYKIENGKERKIEIERAYAKEEIVFISSFNQKEFLTGKLETIYLKTKSSVDVIKLKAEIVKGECSIYIKFDELFINNKASKVKENRIIIE